MVKEVYINGLNIRVIKPVGDFRNLYKESREYRTKDYIDLFRLCMFNVVSLEHSLSILRQTSLLFLLPQAAEGAFRKLPWSRMCLLGFLTLKV